MMNLSRIGDLDIVYDGVPLADHFIVASVSMPLLPNIEAASMFIDGKPGAWFAGRRIGTRDIRVRLKELGDTRRRADAMEVWLGLTDILVKDKICELQLGGGYFVNAILVDDTPMERTGEMSTVEATFRCFDPYIYGKEHTIALTSGTNTITVEGKCPAWATFEITGHSTSYANVLRDVDTGNQVRIPQPLTSATKLIIDMAEHHCTVNGAYKAVDPSVTDFWALTPGKNRLSLSYGSGTLTYRETYL